MPRVVLADDEEFVRDFLKEMLKSTPFRVTAEAQTGDELPVVMMTENPDILLLDINMPNLTGLEFLKEYAQDYPKTCIIMLTSVANEEYVKECLNHNAKYFLRKDTPVETMLESIKDTWHKFKKEAW